MTFLKRDTTVRALRLSAAGAAVLTLTACGGGGEAGSGGDSGGGKAEGASAGEAWQKVRTQIEEADSFRVTMEDDSQGQKATVDLAGHVDAPNSEMSVKSEGEQAMETTVREVDGKAYTKSSQFGGDKWMEQEVPKDKGGFMKQFHQEMLDGLPAGDALKDVESQREEVEVDGEKGYRYTVPEDVESAKQDDSKKKGEGKDGAGETATNMSNVSAFVVSEDDELLALEIDESRGQDSGEKKDGEKKGDEKKDESVEVQFSDWDSVEKAKAPKDDQVMKPEDMSSR